jgi:anti-sigma regulatory factor (Ser/Thr protein kinase)
LSDLIEALTSGISSLSLKDGCLCGSWENAHLVESYDFKTIQNWVIANVGIPASKTQGYRELASWLQSPAGDCLHELPNFKALAQRKKHRYLENAQLVANELITNASRAAGDMNSKIEFSYCVSDEGVIISVTDSVGGLAAESFFSAFKLGSKAPLLESPSGGAGLGLYLIIRYSSVILIESDPGVKTKFSVYIPARPDGTKLFYFKVQRKV